MARHEYRCEQNKHQRKRAKDQFELTEHEQAGSQDRSATADDRGEGATSTGVENCAATDDAFSLTHEFLAMMLGVQRAGVSITASVLQKAGLIQYRHGQVTITNRSGLEDAACECYGAMRVEFEKLFRTRKKSLDHGFQDRFVDTEESVWVADPFNTNHADLNCSASYRSLSGSPDLTDT